MAPKRKAPSGSQPTPPSASRRKTRSDGPPEVVIPLYPDDRRSPDHEERPAKRRNVKRTPSRPILAQTPKRRKNPVKRDEALSPQPATAADDEDCASDELNIVPSPPQRAPQSPPPTRSAMKIINQTPERRSASLTTHKSGGGRRFLEAVEIPSPRRLNPTPRTANAATTPRRGGRISMSPDDDRGSPSARLVKGTKSLPALNVGRMDAPSRATGTPKQQPTRKGKERAVEPPASEGEEDGHTTDDPLAPMAPEEEPDFDDDFPPPAPARTPSKPKPLPPSAKSSPTKALGALLPRHHRLLKAQKIGILRSLQNPPIGEQVNGKESAAATAAATLTTLLKGTTERGEGNSCLVWGQRGSGKSRV